MSRYFFFKRRKRNTGYTERLDGTALSERALYAEEEGKFTQGKFRTVYGVSKKDFDALLMIGVIVTKEWHHTGKSFTKNDFYEWEDEDFLNIYNQHKDDISAMTKALAETEWMYEQARYICPIKSYEEYKEDFSYYQSFRFLTEEETRRKDARHEAISTSGIPDSFQRYMLHKEVDEEYHRLVLSRINDDIMLKEYEEEYGDIIKRNEENTRFNENLKSQNLSTHGKEHYLLQIASFFFEDEDMYQTMLMACKKARSDEEDRQREAKRKAEEKAYNERKAAADKRQNEYLKKCLKAGKAECFNRIEEVPELSHVTLEEMLGKYGWFKAKHGYYNLPIYYSGYRFADKRTLTHYNKLGIVTN